MVRQEQRRYPRRAKSIRFAFTHHGDSHRAVTTSVSLSGAFARASIVPEDGTTLVLEELYAPTSQPLYVKAEVMWGHSLPTLVDPDTGFGLRFVEVYTQGDPHNIEEFLRVLDPSCTQSLDDINFEERSQGVVAAYTFDHSDAEAQLDPEGTSEDEAIDLAQELDRLDEEFRIQSEPALATAAEKKPSGDADDDIEDAATIKGLRRPRAGKRSVTGLFTAIFSRGRVTTQTVDRKRRAADRLLDPLHRPVVQVTWGDQETNGFVARITETVAVIAVGDEGPKRGDVVTIAPRGVSSGIARLRISGLVAGESTDDDDDAPRHITISFGRIDENGRAGRFLDYLRIVNGPES